MMIAREEFQNSAKSKALESSVEYYRSELHKMHQSYSETVKKLEKILRETGRSDIPGEKMTPMTQEGSNEQAGYVSSPPPGKVLSGPKIITFHVVTD